MSHRKSLSLSLLLAAVAVTLLSGCGGSHGGSGAPPSSSGVQLTSLLHQIGACIRSHGMPDWPDPVVNQQTGVVQPAPGADRPPKQALTACQSLFSKLPTSATQGTPIPAAEVSQYYAWAACMRSHGLPGWPDPNKDGTFTLTGTLSASAGRSGAYRSQMNACARYVPAAGIHFTVASPESVTNR